MSYPYQSRGATGNRVAGRYTLENRANKVKQRVLDGGTSNELIKLYADGKVTEVEIDWIKANLLSNSELAQVTVMIS